MSMQEICERCDRHVYHWTVREANLSVGELHRKPHLCEDCTKVVQDALFSALKPPVSASLAVQEGKE